MLTHSVPPRRSSEVVWFGLDAEHARGSGFAVVIGLTTYFSLVAGELVPKQFALRAPERIATVMALPMLWLSRVAAPVVWLLDASTRLVFRLLGLSRDSQDRVTAEELHLIVAEASKSGVIEESERAIISGVEIGRAWCRERVCPYV